MLMITPAFFIDISVVYLERRKVPTVSIIITVLNALGERLWIGARKFPAAPLTSTSISPCFSRTDLIVSMISFSFRTSHELPHTFLLPVDSESVCTALLMFSIFLLMMQTDAPCSRNFLEISQQIPVAPPLMRISLPLKRLGLKIDVIVQIICTGDYRMGINNKCSKIIRSSVLLNIHACYGHLYLHVPLGDRIDDELVDIGSIQHNRKLRKSAIIDVLPLHCTTLSNILGHLRCQLPIPQHPQLERHFLLFLIGNESSLPCGRFSNRTSSSFHPPYSIIIASSQIVQFIPWKIILEQFYKLNQFIGISRAYNHRGGLYVFTGGAIRLLLYFNTMLKEQEGLELEDPFGDILVDGVQEFVKYEKDIGDGYKSKQEKTKERVQKLIRQVHEDRREKRKHRRETDLKKLKEVLSTMNEVEARAYLDGIKAKKKEKKEKVREAMATGQMMIMDLAYEGKMNEKQNKSLGNQVELIMKAIKHTADPPSIHLCGFKGGIRAQMERMRYQHWALTAHEEDVSIFGKDFHERLIYLSPDAQETLDTVNKEDIFILGGLIDRTVLKDASLMRSKELGVKAKRLPITQYMKGRVCLNLDHVVTMVCKFKETGDWKTAFDFAAPKRWKKQEGKSEPRDQSSEENEDDQQYQQKQYNELHGQEETM